ncbi:hypothetical protein BH09BAC1_BH09BAC1_26020 [soil metagenome]
MNATAPYIILLLLATLLLQTACTKKPLEEVIPLPASLWVAQVGEDDTIVVIAACLETVQVEIRGVSEEATFAWTPGNSRKNRIEVKREGAREQWFEYQVTITDTDATYQRLVQILFYDTDSFSKIPRIYETLVPRGGGAYLIDKPECTRWVRIVLYDADSGDEVYRYSGAGRPLWDGTYKGRPAPVGYYYYTLELIFYDGTQSEYDGVMELLR